jgi:hypothetical protein
MTEKKEKVKSLHKPASRDTPLRDTSNHPFRKRNDSLSRYSRKELFKRKYNKDLD